MFIKLKAFINEAEIVENPYQNFAFPRPHDTASQSGSFESI